MKRFNIFTKLTPLWLVLILNSVFANEGAWSDPNNPVKTLGSIRTPDPKEENEPAQMNDPALRLIVRQLMQELKISYEEPVSVYRELRFQAQQSEITVISRYLREELEDNTESRERVRSALTGLFTVVDDQEPSKWALLVQFLQPFFFSFNIFSAVVNAGFLLKQLTRPRHFWIFIVTSLIGMSVYTAYTKKYQEEEARRLLLFRESHQDADICAPEGFLQRIYDTVSSPFFYKQKSECLKFIETQTISIFHSISILEVFVEAIFGGFYASLSSMAKHLNIFFRELYQGAPLIAQIAMTCFMLLMVGKVRTPFFSYEPILLQFGSSIFGSVVGWLEGGQAPSIEPEPTRKGLEPKKKSSLPMKRSPLKIEARKRRNTCSEPSDEDYSTSSEGRS